MPRLYRIFESKPSHTVSNTLPIASSCELSSHQIEWIAIEIGILLLESGAEIYRVEDTVLRIMKAYRINTDIYVLSNGIFLSAFDANMQSSCMIKHAKVPIIHLHRIILANQLARDICMHKCTLTEMRERLVLCQNAPFYPDWLCLLCCGLGCASFCYLFSGSIIDCTCAFVIGIVEQKILFYFERHQLSLMLSFVFASIFITLSSILLGVLLSDLRAQDTLLSGNIITPNLIIIGSIMPLVPGITFTTSIRDFYNCDYLSGTIHLIDALLTALCIAVGVSISIFAYVFISGGQMIP